MSIGLIGGVLGLLLFIVFIVFSAKTWRWHHVTMMCLVYISINVLLIMSAQTLKTRSTWLFQAEDYEKKLTRETKQAEDLTHGKNELEEGVIDLRAKLKRLRTSQGRIWRGLAGQFNPQTGVLQLQAPAPTGLTPQAAIYVFKAVQLGEDANAPPASVAYIGEFRVTNANGNNVTLKNTLPVNFAVQGAQAFTLYETMPADSHYIYSQKEILGPLTDAPEPLFGEMNPQELQTIFNTTIAHSFPGANNNDLRSAVYQAVIDDYLRDGSQANPEMDLPENIFHKVEITAREGYEVEVDSGEEITGWTKNVYNQTGLAIMDNLKWKPDGKPEPVKLRENEFAVFPEPHADQLVAAGTVRTVQKYYVRPLNDYAQEFHENYKRTRDARTEIIQLQKDKVTHDGAIAKTDGQIKFAQDEIEKLKLDLANHTKETSQLAELEAELKALHSQLLKDLADLHAQNRKLATLMEQKVREMKAANEGDLGEPKSGD